MAMHYLAVKKTIGIIKWNSVNILVIFIVWIWIHSLAAEKTIE